MTTNNRKIADEVNKNAETVFFIEHADELFVISGKARASLPEEVQIGQREPTRTERLRALEMQGYEI
jgi:hypothetical protein